MAYCQNCGAEMSANANFCPNCGAMMTGEIGTNHTAAKYR